MREFWNEVRSLEITTTNDIPNILKPKEAYIVEYPEAVKFANTQLGIFWLPDEIAVEKDVQDILVNMTPAERHGVITTLKLFTLYELIVGGEYWQTLVFDRFRRPADIQRMANCFSFFELNVHAPFYSKINEALNLADEKFYTDYLNDPVLVDRIKYLHDGASGESTPLSLANLAIVEGVVLYSSFAFLKHFQSQGKNKLVNVVRGINFSVRDEGLHSLASCWLFKQLAAEGGFNTEDVEEDVREACEVAYEHEKAIIEKVFEKGAIEGITKVQMTHFVEHRIDVVLGNLGYSPMFDVTYNPVGTWFYKGVNNYVSNDFFVGVGREYVRNWEESAFVW